MCWFNLAFVVTWQRVLREPDVVSHYVHNHSLPRFPLNPVVLHCLLVVCHSLVEPLTIVLFGVTDELAETILIVWLDEPDVLFCNCRSVLRGKGVVVPDFAIVIVTPHLQVRELAFSSDVTAANCLSTALGCTIVNGTNSNSGHVGSGGWSNRFMRWEQQKEVAARLRPL